MTAEEKLAHQRLSVLELAQALGSVREACKVMSYSRDSFYRFKQLYERHSEAGLQEISRRKPNPKNRVDAAVEEAVVAMATEYPAYGQVRVSNELKQRGVFVSPGGVRSIWLRHSLETFRKRLQVLEKQLAANQSMSLTEAQVAALEELQTDLDEWVEQYNRERAHTGKYGFGRTPWQTFRETKHWAQAKQLATLFEWQQPQPDIPDSTSPEVVG